MTPIRHYALGTLIAALTAALPLASQAADAWPSKPIQVVVPAGAGGDTDFNARTMARYFEKMTGTTMIVTNMNGGGGTMAMNKVQTAQPDGNTMLFGHIGFLIVNEVSGLIDYKFDDKLAISSIPAVDKSVVLVAGKESGLKTVGDVVSKSKAAEGSVIYGTEFGGFSHLQGLMFQKAAGITMKFVDVGSASDKITSLLGGRIGLASISYGAVQDYQKTGDMAMVAQYSSTPNPLLGDIKTFDEQGIKLDMTKPYVIAFPKGTDPAIVKKMSDIMEKITQDPGYAKALEDGFKQPVTFYPTDAAVQKLNEIRTDLMQYKDLLRQR
ncbi:MAG: tripartite tricarboxylate transporter substrate binding protein [Castellaniella sp.]|uniref:tripartite tricarboxylate transporter substrate binding protein n=1 Tax=Castellaniella sp. TaxID=1955812 RepID=UPI003C71B117